MQRLQVLAGAAGAAPVQVYTIHNLAYQGLFTRAQFVELGLPATAFAIQGLEFHDQMSFMKAGLFYADHLTTVSPSYAQEIQTPEQGCGLDGLLRERSACLTGILNGVDETVWDPAQDPAIVATYHAQRPQGKTRCKAALQARMEACSAAQCLAVWHCQPIDRTKRPAAGAVGG